MNQTLFLPNFSAPSVAVDSIWPSLLNPELVDWIDTGTDIEPLPEDEADHDYVSELIESCLNTTVLLSLDEKNKLEANVDRMLIRAVWDHVQHGRDAEALAGFKLWAHIASVNGSHLSAAYVQLFRALYSLECVQPTIAKGFITKGTKSLERAENCSSEECLKLAHAFAATLLANVSFQERDELPVIRKKVETAKRMREDFEKTRYERKGGEAAPRALAQCLYASELLIETRLSHRTEDYALARESSKKAEVIYRDIRSIKGMVHSRLEQARADYYGDHFDSANAKFLTAAKVYLRFGFLPDFCLVLTYLARNELKRGNLRRAQLCSDECITVIASKLEDASASSHLPEDAQRNVGREARRSEAMRGMCAVRHVRALEVIGRVKLQELELDEATEHLEKSLAAAVRYGLVDEAAFCYVWLARACRLIINALQDRQDEESLREKDRLRALAHDHIAKAQELFGPGGRESAVRKAAKGLALIKAEKGLIDIAFGEFRSGIGSISESALDHHKNKRAYEYVETFIDAAYALHLNHRQEGGLQFLSYAMKHERDVRETDLPARIQYTRLLFIAAGIRLDAEDCEKGYLVRDDSDVESIQDIADSFLEDFDGKRLNWVSLGRVLCLLTMVDVPERLRDKVAGHWRDYYSSVDPGKADRFLLLLLKNEIVASLHDPGKSLSLIDKLREELGSLNSFNEYEPSLQELQIQLVDDLDFSRTNLAKAKEKKMDKVLRCMLDDMDGSIEDSVIREELQWAFGIYERILASPPTFKNSDYLNMTELGRKIFRELGKRKYEERAQRLMRKTPNALRVIATHDKGLQAITDGFRDISELMEELMARDCYPFLYTASSVVEEMETESPPSTETDHFDLYEVEDVNTKRCRNKGGGRWTYPSWSSWASHDRYKCDYPTIELSYGCGEPGGEWNIEFLAYLDTGGDVFLLMWDEFLKENSGRTTEALRANVVASSELSIETITEDPGFICSVRSHNLNGYEIFPTRGKPLLYVNTVSGWHPVTSKTLLRTDCAAYRVLNAGWTRAFEADGEKKQIRKAIVGRQFLAAIPLNVHLSGAYGNTKVYYSERVPEEKLTRKYWIVEFDPRAEIDSFADISKLNASQCTFEAPDGDEHHVEELGRSLSKTRSQTRVEGGRKIFLPAQRFSNIRGIDLEGNPLQVAFKYEFDARVFSAKLKYAKGVDSKMFSKSQ